MKLGHWSQHKHATPKGLHIHGQICIRHFQQPKLEHPRFRITQPLGDSICFKSMKRYVENKIRQWLGEDNPSLLWLAYLLPFGLPIVNTWGKGVVAGWVLLCIGVLLLFVRGTRRHRHSWRMTLFLPVLVLLLSTVVSFYLVPQWHLYWSLLSMALSSGWLWRIEETLARENPLSIEEWLFSARLFGIGSLGYMLICLLGLHRFGWSEWAPMPLIIIGVVLHQARVHKASICWKQSFCCPIGTPLVRMAIVRGNELWLTKRPYTGCFVEDKEAPCHAAIYRDQPLTTCVNPGETPEEAIHRAYCSIGLKLKETPRFLLKYGYHPTPENERVVYLFVLNLRGYNYETTLNMRGHFYSPEKIDHLIAKDYFQPQFVEEYKYLKNTLLRANAVLDSNMVTE